ncbi:MAG: hypothetical protein ACYCW6_26370 [Candidatus Xenobia bacterium]
MISSVSTPVSLAAPAAAPAPSAPAPAPAPQDQCDLSVRARVASLENQAAVQKGTALKLAAIGVGFGAIVGLGAGFGGGAMVAAVGLLPAGICFANSVQLDNQAKALRNTYHC